ncbi:MAG: putative glycoside hydrolase [Gemmatimonadetes bacterium]|nr:putative glycoside hydrolase [Gemmatimonadota bacterium]
MKPFVTVMLFAALLSGCDDGDRQGSPAAASPATPTADPVHGDLTPEDPTAAEVEPDPPARTFFHFTRPEHVRGIYVNSWSAGSRRRLAALIDLAARTEINSFVIDIKDASGYVSHPTGVRLAHEIGATGEIRIPDLAWTLERLEEAGIYPIARIVIVKDPLLAAARPELAVQDTAGGTWVDNRGIVWLNPFSREVWDYHVDLAREVAAMGVGEVQWDYVRFPDASASALGRASYPGQDGRAKTDAIRAFLDYSRGNLSEFGAKVTADVFGVTTSTTRDVGIGQVWETFIDVVDVALPMIYPSHYREGNFGIDEPNAHPYEVVRQALEDALSRSAELEGAGTTRPWLQDFTLGPPRYEAPEVRAQIQAAYDVGIDEWVLWNPSSRYTQAALEPAGGFVEEPLVRIANEIVPVSRRFELFDTTTAIVETPAEEPVEGNVEAAGAPAKPRPDTTRVGSFRPGSPR